MPSSRYFASCWVRVRRPLAVAEAEIVKPSRTAQWPCPFWARPRLFAENWPNKPGAASLMGRLKKIGSKQNGDCGRTAVKAKPLM